MRKQTTIRLKATFFSEFIVHVVLAVAMVTSYWSSVGAAVSLESEKQLGRGATLTVSMLATWAHNACIKFIAFHFKARRF
jgi:hypothetical protein